VTTKSKIISFILFAVFFFIGWELGFSPLKENLLSITERAKNILHAPPVTLLPNYISENQYKIDVLSYDMNLELYPEKKLLEGDVLITGLILDKTLSSLDFNLYDNMQIESLSLNDIEAQYENKDSKLSIPLSNSLQGTPFGELDTFRVKLKYKGTPVRMGLGSFIFGKINEQSVVYNLSEPTFASTWFPCNDIPTDKALLDIKITNDSSQTSVSNGVLVDEKITGSRKTCHWKTYYPISTYLISVYSSKYLKFKDEYISPLTSEKMPIEYYVFPEDLEEAKIDFKDHPKMISFFSKTFGEYPFIKEKYGVAEFLWQLGAMEHQTITGIGSNFVSGRRFFEDIYVHELAHHWWGNAVGPISWNDIWLNEGFATYSEALYAEYKAGANALQSVMLSKFQENFTGKLSEPGNNLFSTTVYDKGGWVLHMLRWEVGDSLFFKILRSYYENYKYKNASTKDFQTVCETLSGKNLNQFFNQWIYEGEGQIDLVYDWTSEKEDDNYSLTIELKQTQDAYNVYHFPLEVEIMYKNGEEEFKTFYVDERLKQIDFKIKTDPSNITLDPNNWLLANIRKAEKE
jgi:aminopeptidase N